MGADDELVADVNQQARIARLSALSPRL